MQNDKYVATGIYFNSDLQSASGGWNNRLWKIGGVRRFNSGSSAYCLNCERMPLP
jgi:hypothetical protein